MIYSRRLIIITFFNPNLFELVWLHSLLTNAAGCDIKVITVVMTNAYIAITTGNPVASICFNQSITVGGTNVNTYTLAATATNFTYEDNLTDEERKHNGEVFAYSAELEESEWEEFCNIIKDKKTGLKSWWD